MRNITELFVIGIPALTPSVLWTAFRSAGPEKQKEKEEKGKGRKADEDEACDVHCLAGPYFRACRIFPFQSGLKPL